MVTIAGGIILAIVLIIVFGAFFVAMFSGFSKSPSMGCLTVFVFGFMLVALAMCVFG